MCNWFDQAATDRTGQAEVALKQFLLGIARIAAEDFVAAVACQHALEPRCARSLGAEIGWHRRFVAERLIVFVGNDGNRRHDVGRLQVILVRPAAVALGGTARIFHFVKPVGVKADGKSVDRRAACGGEGADDGGTVSAAGEKCCGGGRIDIAHGLIQHAAEIASMAAEVGIDRGVIRLPVKPGFDLAVFQADILPRQQFMHALIDAAGRRDGVKVEVVVDRLRVDGTPHCGVGSHALHAAAEYQLAAFFGVTEALDPDPVNGQKGAFLERFEYCEGEISA